MVTLSLKLEVRYLELWSERKKSALHTNFWEDVKCYGACEGRNRGFGPLSSAIRSPFSQFWAEGAVPAKLPPKGPLSDRPFTPWMVSYKNYPTVFLLFRQRTHHAFITFSSNPKDSYGQFPIEPFLSTTIHYHHFVTKKNYKNSIVGYILTET